MLARAETQLVLATQAIDSLEKDAHDRDLLESWGTDFANSRIQLARQWTTLASQTAFLISRGQI